MLLVVDCREAHRLLPLQTAKRLIQLCNTLTKIRAGIVNQMFGIAPDAVRQLMQLIAVMLRMVFHILQQRKCLFRRVLCTVMVVMPVFYIMH